MLWAFWNSVAAPATWFLWLAILMHLNWACELLLLGQGTGVTAIAVMHQLFGSVKIDAVLMLGVSVLAAFGLLTTAGWQVPLVGRYGWFDSLTHWVGLCLILPQQCILMASAYGGMYAIVTRHYLDGTGPMPPGHLWDDQSVYLFICFWHTIAVIYHHTAEITDLFRVVMR